MRWIDHYLVYTGEFESPTIFHKWVGFFMLSSVLGRRVYLPFGNKQLFPNLFVVLVAGSARCRKTTAAEIGVKMLKQIENVVFFPSKFTEATMWRFAHDMTEKMGDAVFVIYADELCVLMREKDEDLIALLTKWYGGPDEDGKATKTQGEDYPKNICINFLTTTTVSDFVKIFPTASLERGFLPRLAVIFAVEPRKRNSWPKLREDMEEGLIRDLMAYNQLTGPMKMTVRALEWWDKWYQSFPWTQDEVLDGFYGRKGDMILKLAILYGIMNHREVMAIDREDLELALQDVEALENTTAKIFKIISDPTFLFQVERIVGQLRKLNGSANKRTLMRSLGLRKEIMDAALKFLLDIGKVFFDAYTGHYKLKEEQ